MPVTRKADFPAEVAALVDAFSRCCEGNEVDHIVEAAANFMTMSLHAWAKAHRYNLSQAESFGRSICKSLVDDLAKQWNRTAEPDDIEVRRN